MVSKYRKLLIRFIESKFYYIVFVVCTHVFSCLFAEFSYALSHECTLFSSSCIFWGLFAVRKTVCLIFPVLLKNELTTVSHFPSSFTTGAHSFKGASLLILMSGRAIWIVFLNLCLSIFCGALLVLDVGIHMFRIFFCICLSFVLMIFPRNLGVHLPMKSLNGGILLNSILTSSFVILSSFIFSHRVHLMAEWWNALSFFRLVLVRFHISDPQRRQFSGPERYIL